MSVKSLLVCALVFLILCSVNLVYADEPDYQDTLLNFYTQQLVAHGASLFAATSAAFVFITRLIPKKREKKPPTMRALIFIFFSGFLIGSVVFLGFRMFLYGALASGTIFFPTRSVEYAFVNATLGDYNNDVIRYTFGEDMANAIVPFKGTYIGNKPVLVSLLKTFSGGMLEVPAFGGFALCLVIGLFPAYLIYYGFADHSLKDWEAWLWFFCFLVPPLYGLVGVIAYRITFLDWFFLVFAAICYIGTALFLTILKSKKCGVAI